MRGQRKILIVAYAGQGHVNPAIRFANRLIKMGIDVTFCTSLSVVQPIDKVTIPQGLTFAPFSDGHDSGKQPTTTLHQYISDFASYGASAVAEIINSAVAAGQPFDHLIYTTVIPWAARVAHAHGVKSSLLWCQSATVLDIYYYYFNEHEGFISSNINNPTFPIKLPGLPPLAAADLPSFILPSNPKEHEFLVPILKDHIEVLKFAPGILVNTFNELEVESLRAIEQLEYLPIGPLIPSEFMDGKVSSDTSMGKDFFDKTEDDYIQWLNTKPKSSVVFVSFGTIASFTIDQMEEMAEGLLESRRPFLWVIRDGEQAGRLSKIEGVEKAWDDSALVFSGGGVESPSNWVFRDALWVEFDGGDIGGWCSCGGVSPMVGSGNNGKMMEDVWRTGVRVTRREEDGVVDGTEIARCVEMVMGNEDMKKNAEKWRELAREALDCNGSAIINLLAFLNKV